MQDLEDVEQIDILAKNGIKGKNILDNFFKLFEIRTSVLYDRFSKIFPIRSNVWLDVLTRIASSISYLVVLPFYLVAIPFLAIDTLCKSAVIKNESSWLSNVPFFSKENTEALCQEYSEIKEKRKENRLEVKASSGGIGRPASELFGISTMLAFLKSVKDKGGTIEEALDIAREGIDSYKRKNADTLCGYYGINSLVVDIENPDWKKLIGEVNSNINGSGSSVEKIKDLIQQPREKFLAEVQGLPSVNAEQAGSSQRGGYRG